MGHSHSAEDKIWLCDTWLEAKQSDLTSSSQKAIKIVLIFFTGRMGITEIILT
jgi:hypothetical protein